MTQQKNNSYYFGLNKSYVETLKKQWQQDSHSVSKEWQLFFQQENIAQEKEPVLASDNAARVKISLPKKIAITDDDIKYEKMLGMAQKLAQNMQLSLEIPTATSVRDIGVKALEENRLIINDYLKLDALGKCSYTHLIAYAVVQAIKMIPSMNNGCEQDNDKFTKLIRKNINLGLAIDLPSKNQGRTLVVPNIKKSQDMNFWQFFTAYNDIVNKARNNSLKPDDFIGTTVTLTNPGSIGNVSSTPRLMMGQGSIIATGRIGYKAQYESTSAETLRALGIGKVMTISSTYDHRVIQGAESGQFLQIVHELLAGNYNFYEQVFQALSTPHCPYVLSQDKVTLIGQDANIKKTERAMKVSQLIHSYRVRGHLLANVDPLNLMPRNHYDLSFSTYGLSLWDLDREFDTFGVLQQKKAPLRDILTRLRHTYCRRMGVEYMYINSAEERSWLQKRIEGEPEQLTAKENKRIFNHLVQAEVLEQFLHKRYMGHKRFSIEGADSVIPMLHDLLDQAANCNVSDVVIGMSHRGRLNVLANVVGKPYEAILAEFENIDAKTVFGSGDVKYHLGAKGIYKTRCKIADSDNLEERKVRVELACNPSHLESVNPVVEGMVRAKQDMFSDRDRNKIIPILLHGDAAFAGQGIVYETLQMSNLKGYRTGGTVHIIVNNQIGYTTTPEKSRSSLNASDLARAIFAPIFRVNGDDPESCIRALRIAFEYRMKFGKDVIIDLVCYRRHGHNEGDEPSFTQPILYKAIKNHPSVSTRYGDLLVRRKDLTELEIEEIISRHHNILDNCFKKVREKGYEAVPSFESLFIDDDFANQKSVTTKVPKQTLVEIIKKITFDPQIINIHPRVKKSVLQKRFEVIESENNLVDFGLSENLAYASLLLDKIPVRFSGQDCGRGTFAHRHAVLYDVDNGSPYIPLNYLEKTIDEGEEKWHPSRFRIYDSLLSEAAVLGFEYGYSVTHPKSLVIWEAQFGDFFNGAQVQVDQFIASAETKWGQRNKLVMLLPHGYDGQGPEHSSARIERFLQLCAQNNLRIANCSNSAQLFHLLRLQAMSPKKPLIIFTHKSLLRSEVAASKLTDFSSGQFQKIILDPVNSINKNTKRIIFCSGKIYWDLDKERKVHSKKYKNISIIRVEQLYPFAKDDVANILSQVGDVKLLDFVWCQEEPKNSGAYYFVERLFNKLGLKNLRFIGRGESPSPASGSLKTHKIQQEKIISLALSDNMSKLSDVEV